MIKKCLLCLMMMSICLVTTVYSFDGEDFKSQGDEYWKNRDQLESLVKAIDCYKKAIELDPNNAKLFERLSFASFYHGWALKELKGYPYKEKRKAIFTSGMKYAENALAISPEDTMARFRYILNKLMYRREFSIASSAKMVPEVRDTMQMVMNKDKFLESGGPQRVMANLIIEVPALLRPAFSLGNLDDAEKMVKEAIDFDGRFILNYVTLADIYMKQRKKKEAKAQLQIAIDYPVDPDYEYAAENRRDRKVAIEKMQEYFGR